MSLTREVLEHLAEFGVVMLKAFLPANYPEARLTRKLLGLDGPCRHRFRPSQMRTISSMLSRLRQQGLVERQGPKKNGRWGVTGEGIEYLKEKKEKRTQYHVELVDLPKPDGAVRLVTFDIPEKQRRKRDWLRLQLAACDFKPLQRSVWIGMRPLPEELIKEMDDQNLGECVHIVSVTKQGTLSDFRLS